MANASRILTKALTPLFNTAGQAGRLAKNTITDATQRTGNFLAADAKLTGQRAVGAANWTGKALNRGYSGLAGHAEPTFLANTAPALDRFLNYKPVRASLLEGVSPVESLLKARAARLGRPLSTTEQRVGRALKPATLGMAGTASSIGANGLMALNNYDTRYEDLADGLGGRVAIAAGMPYAEGQQLKQDYLKTLEAANPISPAGIAGLGVTGDQSEILRNYAVTKARNAVYDTLSKDEVPRAGLSRLMAPVGQTLQYATPWHYGTHALARHAGPALARLMGRGEEANSLYSPGQLLSTVAAKDKSNQLIPALNKMVDDTKARGYQAYRKTLGEHSDNAYGVQSENMDPKVLARINELEAGVKNSLGSGDPNAVNESIKNVSHTLDVVQAKNMALGQAYRKALETGIDRSPEFGLDIPPNVRNYPSPEAYYQASARYRERAAQAAAELNKLPETDLIDLYRQTGLPINHYLPQQ